MTPIATAQRSRTFRFAVSACALSLLGLFAPTTTAAQLIVVKTMPIADSDQFSFFPSLTLGMGGTRIAVADSLHDPFVNPALGARVRQSLFFSAPTFFSVSGKAGSGSTVPVGALGKRGSSFGGTVVAIQSINDAQPLGTASGFFDAQSTSSADSRSNRYGFVLVGHTFAASRISLGASAFWSDLGSIDGTSLLYTDSRNVNQAGGAADFRLGMLKEWNGGRSLEALVFSRRVGMTHDVTYGDPFFEPISRRTIIRERMQHERDRTNTRGIHLEYLRPVGDSGWRAGVILTANQIDNPSRPAYEIETASGRRGRAAAFNVGFGLARSLGGTTLAADAIYEPIWSHIWGVSDSLATASGRTVQPGAKISDSRLHFSNAVLRIGGSHELELDRDAKAQMQLGVQARSISYKLKQHDLLNDARRAGERSWMEWMPTWGMTLRRAAIEFSYRGSKTTGAGRPGLPPVGTFAVPPQPLSGFGGVDVRTPGPTSTIRDVSVMTHQVSISLLVR